MAVMLTSADLWSAFPNTKYVLDNLIPIFWAVTLNYVWWKIALFNISVYLLNLYAWSCVTTTIVALVFWCLICGRCWFGETPSEPLLRGWRFSTWRDPVRALLKGWRARRSLGSIFDLSEPCLKVDDFSTWRDPVRALLKGWRARRSLGSIFN
jgi:hypothetical protein